MKLLRTLFLGCALSCVVLPCRPLLAQEPVLTKIWSEIKSNIGQFSAVTSAVQDSKGNIYVVDAGSYCIHVFNRNGKHLKKWSNYGPAGKGSPTYPMQIAIGRDDSIFVTDGTNCVYQLDGKGKLVRTIGIPGNIFEPGVEIEYPIGVAVDSLGNVFVVDKNRLMKFSPVGVLLNASAPKDARNSLGAFGLTIAPDGTLYIPHISVHSENTITAGTSVKASMGILCLKPDGSIFQQIAMKRRPYAVDIDREGDLYITTADGWLEKRDKAGQLLQEWYIQGEKVNPVHFPFQVVLGRAGRVSVVDKNGIRLLHLGDEVALINKWKLGNKRPFETPGSLLAHPNGTVLVTDAVEHNLQFFDPTGTVVSKWEMGENTPYLKNVSGMAVNQNGQIYLLTLGNKVFRLDRSGNLIDSWGGTGQGNGQFSFPQSIAVDTSNNVYILDGNHRVQKFTEQGIFISQWGRLGSKEGEFRQPMGITVDREGNLFVADTGNCRIQKFDAQGKFLKQWGIRGAKDAQFEWPEGLTVDRANNLYVSDRGNGRIQKFDSDGKHLSTWGVKKLQSGFPMTPTRIGVDARFNVYVMDQVNQCVYVFKQAMEEEEQRLVDRVNDEAQVGTP